MTFAREKQYSASSHCLSRDRKAGHWANTRVNHLYTDVVLQSFTVIANVHVTAVHPRPTTDRTRTNVDSTLNPGPQASHGALGASSAILTSCLNILRECKQKLLTKLSIVPPSFLSKPRLFSPLLHMCLGIDWEGAIQRCTSGKVLSVRPAFVQLAHFESH